VCVGVRVCQQFNQRFSHNSTAVKWLTANAKNKTRIAGKQAPENPIGGRQPKPQSWYPADSWL